MEDFKQSDLLEAYYKVLILKRLYESINYVSDSMIRAILNIPENKEEE